MGRKAGLTSKIHVVVRLCPISFWLDIRPGAVLALRTSRHGSRMRPSRSPANAAHTCPGYQRPSKTPRLDVAVLAHRQHGDAQLSESAMRLMDQRSVARKIREPQCDSRLRILGLKAHRLQQRV